MLYFLLVTSICISIRPHRRRTLVLHNIVGQSADLRFQMSNCKLPKQAVLLLSMFCFVLSTNSASAQKGEKDTTQNKLHLLPLTDTSKTKKHTSFFKKLAPLIRDTSAEKKHIPQVATRRSLILPGWGQAYNHDYWKIPLVYGALAIPTATYIFNNNYYKELKFAYEARYKAAYVTNPTTGGLDSTDYKTLEDIYKRVDAAAIQNARTQVRKNRDYSILWFFIVWGLNVADATVYGHLKGFNVSDDLTLHIQPKLNPNVFGGAGVSLVFSFKTPTYKVSPVLSSR